MASIINKNPELNHEIDLVNREIVSGESRFAFKISEGARESLLNGKWDPLDELLKIVIKLSKYLQHSVHLDFRPKTSNECSFLKV